MNALVSFILCFILFAGVSAKTHCYEINLVISEGEKYPTEKKSSKKKSTQKESDDAISIDIKRDIVAKDILLEYSPTHKDLSIVVSKHLKGSKVIVYNTEGIEIYHTKITANLMKRISANHWNKGVYFVKFITTNGVTNVKKFVCY